MGRGFLSGIFMGAIVSAVLIFVSSQVLERQTLSFPKPSASAVEVPAGTEFDQARAESDPVVPEAETRPSGEAVVEAPVPDDAPDAPPSLDTSALEVPTPEVDTPQELETVGIDESDPPSAPEADSQASVGDVSGLETPDAPGDAPQKETGSFENVQAPAEDTAPDAGTAETAPQVDTEISALPQAEVEIDTSENPQTAPAVASEDTAPSALEAPEVGSEPSLPVVGADDPGVTVIEIIGNQSPERAESGRPLIEIIEPEADVPNADASSDEELPSFLRPVEVLENAGEVETARLPQVEDAAPETAAPLIILPEPGEETAQETEPAPAPEPEETEADTRQANLPTIRRPGEETNVETDAAEEETAEVEGGAEAEVESGDLPAIEQYAVAFENPNGNPLLSVVLVHAGTLLTPTQLEELPEALAFGIEAGAADAAEVAQHYRSAGREVVMIPSLPQGAQPQDVEQALRVNFETVSQAVAVMDVSGGSFQSDRAAVSQVVDVITESGHGLITFPRGLNTAHQQANRAGVATGLIFRALDANGESSEQVQRTLDRAAFRARQDEAVILVGTTQATTLIAMVEWVLGNRAQSVTLAPISAALIGGGS